MEVFVGQIWDRLINRVVAKGYPCAVIRFDQIEKTAGIYFRALGGDSGLSLKATQPIVINSKQSWLRRISGIEQTADYVWSDCDALYLPVSIETFPDPQLNRDLYFWLIALAARTPDQKTGNWLVDNQQATRLLLETFSGLKQRYHQLVQATLAIRPVIDSLPQEQAVQEHWIRQALINPGTVVEEISIDCHTFPVPLWLHPLPQVMSASSGPSAKHVNHDLSNNNPDSTNSAEAEVDPNRRKASWQEMEERKDGLMMFFRAESLLSWAEFINVNRPTEDDDSGNARKVADEMKNLNLMRDGKTVTAKIRFDLDLPPEIMDDQPLGEGILLPEWDYKKQRMQLDHCCLQPMIAINAEPVALPQHLTKTAQYIRRQFEHLATARSWQRNQEEGAEIDIDAFVQQQVEQRCGSYPANRGLFKSFSAQERNLACLLLADFSQSTDAYINQETRIIDVIRDSLYLFAEALTATSDPFGIYGFSSIRREQIRFHVIKTFRESYNGEIRGRIGQIKPGYYTRMGAAIRHAGNLLAEQDSRQRILFLLTDGKPNDLDHYEGRYGIEDTRQAIHEIKSRGIRPFCITIDEKAGEYLAYLFGSNGFIVINNPIQLPRRLLALYAQMIH